MISEGTDIIFKIERAEIKPHTAIKIPLYNANTTEVFTAQFTFRTFPTPRSCPVITLEAVEKPKKNSIKNPLIVEVLPTAASAFLLINRPAIVMSSVLKSCKIMLVATIGNTKSNILLIIGPSANELPDFPSVSLTTKHTFLFFDTVFIIKHERKIINRQKRWIL